MKRLLLLVCALALLLCACTREKNGKDTDVLAHEVRAALSDNTGFTEIDDDFVEISFDFLEKTDDATVLIDNTSSTREIGIFHLRDQGDMSAVESGIQSYLHQEIDSLHSLASLYPGAELTEKLQRYEKATVLKSGSYIGYFVLDGNELATAKAAFLAALQ
ncbi:MAG: hypothetical protein IJW51_04955 [Clostridia bacterium]|nr:hypothetical protein [Clostridia bacterium]